MNRHYRILIGKPGLDGHDRGAKYVAHLLRDAGFEVIYTGIRRTPEEIVNTAIQEDVDAIGISLLSGAHLNQVGRVIALLREAGMEDLPVFAGGVIPEADIPPLKEIGVVEVYGPGTLAADLISSLRGHLENAKLLSPS